MRPPPAPLFLTWPESQEENRRSWGGRSDRPGEEHAKTSVLPFWNVHTTLKHVMSLWYRLSHSHYTATHIYNPPHKRVSSFSTPTRHTTQKVVNRAQMRRTRMSSSRPGEKKHDCFESSNRSVHHTERAFFFWRKYVTIKKVFETQKIELKRAWNQSCIIRKKSFFFLLRNLFIVEKKYLYKK